MLPLSSSLHATLPVSRRAAQQRRDDRARQTDEGCGSARLPRLHRLDVLAYYVANFTGK